MATKYLIGIDFGDGETTASCYEIGKEPSRLKISNSTDENKFKCKSVVYQIFQNDGTYSYQLNIGTGCALHISFKDEVCKLNKNRERKEAFENFIKHIYKNIKKNNSLKDNEFLLYIACPTKWDEKSKKDYKEFVEKAINRPIEWVINESDAAYFSKKNDTTYFSEKRNNLVLIVDFGSSTIDYTLMYNNKKINIDHLSKRLGARIIELDLLNYYKFDADSNYQERKNKSEIIKLKQGNPHLDIDTALKLEIRECKEDTYTNAQGNSPKLLIFRAPIDLKYMEKRLNEEDIEYHINFDDFEKKHINNYIDSVSNNFREVKEEVYKRCEKLNINPAKLQIILSGGASIMPWVKESLQEIFNTTNVENDDRPEYIVSDGIVKYAYALWNVKTELSKITDKFHDWFSTAESELKDMIQQECREICLETTKNDPKIIDYCSASFENKAGTIDDNIPENPYKSYYKSSIKGFMSIVDEVNQDILSKRKVINDNIYQSLNQKLHNILYQKLHQALLDTLQIDINEMAFLQSQSFLPTINNDLIGSDSIQEISRYCIEELQKDYGYDFKNTGYGNASPFNPKQGSYRKKRDLRERKLIAESYYKYIESKSFAPYSDEELKQIKDGIYSQVIDAIINITTEHLAFEPCGYDLKKELFSKDEVTPQRVNSESTISHNSTPTDTKVEKVFSMKVTGIQMMGTDTLVTGEIKLGEVAEGDTLFIGYDHPQMVHVKKILDNEAQVGGLVRMLLDCNHTLIKIGTTIHSKTFKD